MFVCPVPKISQVMMKWRRRASHIGRFTLHKGRRATQLNRFTLRHNRRRAAQPGLMHEETVTNYAEKCGGLIQSKILLIQGVKF